LLCSIFVGGIAGAGFWFPTRPPSVVVWQEGLRDTQSLVSSHSGGPHFLTTPLLQKGSEKLFIKKALYPSNKVAVLVINFNLKGDFFGFFFFMYVNKHCFICRPSDSTVSEDAGIYPSTVATFTLIARRYNHSARSHSPLS
jgi:hypothetical protein